MMNQGGSRWSARVTFAHFAFEVRLIMISKEDWARFDIGAVERIY